MCQEESLLVDVQNDTFTLNDAWPTSPITGQLFMSSEMLLFLQEIPPESTALAEEGNLHPPPHQEVNPPLAQLLCSVTNGGL